MLEEMNMTDGEITRDALRELIKSIDKAGSVEKLKLSSISTDRTAVVCGGLAIVHAVMKTLKVKRMQASTVALREGLIFDMVGKDEHINIQSQTLSNLVARYDIDVNQAKRVNTSVEHFFNQVKKDWQLDSDTDLALLQWAATLHEIGKAVAHTQYHKHGAYIIENSDLMGFSVAEQKSLALLIRFHRRKFDMSAFDHLQKGDKERLVRLLSLLRLSVLLHRGRHNADYEQVDSMSGLKKTR